MTTLLAFLFTFIGGCALLISYIRGKDIKILSSLSVAALVTGLWLFSDSEMKQLFFSNYTLWKYVTAITFYSLPACYYNLIKHFLHNRFSKMLSVLSLEHLVFMFITIFLDLVNIISVINTQEAYFLLFGVNILLCFFILVKSYSEWTVETKIFTSGFIALCLFGIFDLINWNFNVNHSSSYLTQWGVLIFLSSLSVILIYNFINAKYKAAAYSRQLNEAIINDQLKTEFFANVSHELRTPLNVILSTLQLLYIYVDDGSISSEKRNLRKYFDIMKQNCYRLIRLVGNIIDMTKIDSGYIKPEMTNQNIVQIVEDITQSVAEYIKSKNLEIVFDTEIEEKFMACDPEKVERIILNLLSNAVKFTSPGGKIHVTIHDEVNYVQIHVQDTGVGIKKEKLSVIFDRFMQVDKSLSRHHEGSGIGLSLVKSLVEMQGGTIEVESEYGKGTIFIVTFPTSNISECPIQNNAEINIIHEEKISIEFSDMSSL
jgi:signal transduction histidine kinase